MNRKIIFIIAMLLTLQGCIVKSLHPFYTSKDVVFKDELLASWKDQDNNKWRIERVTGHPNTYELHWLSKGSRDVVFHGHLFELERKLYFDFFPVDDHSTEEEMTIFNLHLLPTHSVARVEMISSGEVQIKWFNEAWLASLFEQNRIKISHEVVKGESEEDGAYVLTASTEELQKFIVKYGDDEKAYDDNNTVWLKLDKITP